MTVVVHTIQLRKYIRSSCVKLFNDSNIRGLTNINSEESAKFCDVKNAAGAKRAEQIHAVVHSNTEGERKTLIKQGQSLISRKSSKFKRERDFWNWLTPTIYKS